MSIIKDQHMRAAMWSLFVLGLAHVEFSTPVKKRLYSTYKYVVLVLFLSFNISQIIEVPIVAMEKRYSHLIENLSVTLLYVSSSVKFLTLMRGRIKYLVNDVRAVERVIQEDTDSTMKTIFEKYRGYNEKLSGLILFLGVLTIILWFANPALNYLDWTYSKHAANATFQRTLIFGSWFPFDWRKNYWTAYFIQFTCGTYGATITVAPDAFLWSFMTFVLMNLEILKYKINNIPEHAKVAVSKNPWMDERYAIRFVCIKCIKLHQTIIRFVENLDLAMNFLMLIDFFICSMQIGASVLRVLFFGDTPLMLFSAGEYLAGILTQLMLFYWHANEILLESQNIATTVMSSEWYDYDEDVKKDLQFVMLRAQKPLLLNIGPFFFMSTGAAISILRAAYSYIALIRQVYS